MDRQIVARSQGQLTPSTRDQTNLTEWQLRLEKSLFAHLQRMTMEPDFLLEIEQKTEACFNLLMSEGVQQLEQHAANLSTTADHELAVFKEKAGQHVEERIQLASAAANSQASAHAKRLQNETEFHMNQQLRGLVDEAKGKAAEFAVAEVKTTLARADGHIERRAALAIQDMIQHFDSEARVRMNRLLEDSYSSARAELQTVTDGHMIDIRRRVNDEIDRVFHELRRTEERAGLEAIQAQAAEETRILTTTIGNKLESVFREVQKHQAGALKALDERADYHSTIVQQTVQRHVAIAWGEAEASFRAVMSKEVASRLYDHSIEMRDDVEERIRAAMRDRKRDGAIESVMKGFIQQESAEQSHRSEERMKTELKHGLQELESKIEVLIANATSKPATSGAQLDVELQFESVKSNIRDAVHDLDEKIAKIASSIAAASPAALRVEAKAIANENMLALVRMELHEALGTIDHKIKSATEGSTQQASSTAVDDKKQVDALEIATRIQREVQAAVGAIDTRLQAELRQSISSRMPKVVTESAMAAYEQELASVRNEFQDAIRSIESKMTHAQGHERGRAPATKLGHAASGLNTSFIFGSGGTQHEIVIRCQSDAVQAATAPPVKAPVSRAQALERLEAENRAIERAMQDAWDAAADDPDAPEEPTELRALTTKRIEVFLKQFEVYKNAGGSRAWTGFVRPGLLEFVRSCELSDDASDADIFAFLQHQVTTSKTASIAEYEKMFESVAADTDATTPAEQVQSVLMGMEETLGKRQRDGLGTSVPITAYGRIALSKLPRGFNERAVTFDSFTTKREVKQELLKIAAMLA